MSRSPRDPRTVERMMMRFRRSRESDADGEAVVVAEAPDISALLVEDIEDVDIGAVIYEEMLIESVVFVIAPVDRGAVELDLEACEMEAVFVSRLETSKFCCPVFEFGVEFG